MAVDLVELQQEGIVSVGGVDGLQRRIGDVGCELLLLGVREEPVRLDSKHERGLLYQGQGVVEGGDGIEGLLVLALWVSVARDVVGVELAGDGDVAVGVETLDELLALVAQVGLGREVVLGQRLGLGACCRVGATQRRGGGVRCVAELEVGRLRGARSGQGDAAVCARWRTRRAGVLVAVVVDGPVFVRGSRRARHRVDALLLGEVGRVAAEARFKRVATAVRQQRRHARGPEARRRRVSERVVAVVVLGVAVDALALRLAPADAPRTVARRRGDGDDVADIVLAEVRKLEHEHAAHRPAHHGGDLLDAEVVEDQSEDAASCQPAVPRPPRSAHLTSSRTVVSGNSGP